MRSSVITGEGADKHFVENYRFKVLGSEHRAESQKEAADSGQNAAQSLPTSAQPQEGENSAQSGAQNFAPQGGFDLNFVEELLKKTDELSSNIVKLQMQIENQEAEFARRLEAEISRAKEDGVKEGEAAAEQKTQAQIAELEARFSASFTKLAEQYDKVGEFLKSSESELAQTAVNIAKEVVEGEISANSGAIAYRLAAELIKDVSDAKEAQIRVNPADAAYLSAQLEGKKRVKIEPDDAIGKGGVVIISDAGNIDATIQTRLEKVKKIIGE